jgi:hypothetical protein
MPTPFRYRGYAYRIYRNDHPPPCVHIVGPGGEAIVELRGSGLRRHFGVSRRLPIDLTVKAIDERDALLAERERIHGSPKTDR